MLDQRNANLTIQIDGFSVTLQESLETGTKSRSYCRSCGLVKPTSIDESKGAFRERGEELLDSQ